VGKTKDLVGQEFGRLVVIKQAGQAKNKCALWTCRCGCGNTIVVRSDSLRNGGSKSCGCAKAEQGPTFDDLAGQRFGKWLVGEQAGKTEHGHILWNVTCECGNTSVVQAGHLRNETSKACRSCSKTTHGLIDTVEYETWARIVQRCTNTKCEDYVKWGGRGITICDEWRQSFAKFASDMGLRPSDQHSIDRIDNDGPYCKDNCRWATKSQQSRNRNDRVPITAGGETKLLCEWSEITGMSIATLWARLDRGWSEEDTVRTPLLSVAR
jgi:hypothetical protein